MPTYNYKCDSCGDTMSIRQSIKDDPLENCENCNGNIRRIISGSTGLIFKGSGFYLTDYGKTNSNKSEKTNTDKSIKKKKVETTKKKEANNS